ncbi:MAG: DnaJ domain-containing protein [Fimbriimonadaceae bacterium]|nr:DnaJ domain-containing protein [Fimbriimonadaceae bacterium]
MPTLYDILGVPPKADEKEVRSAYRKLARTFHPDLNPDPKAHERMAQINVAFEVLSDPVRRMEYDASIGETGNAEPEQRQTNRKRAVVATIARRLRDHRTPVYAMGFAPGANRLATASFDNEVIFWSPSYEYPESRVRLEGGVVSAMSVQGPERVVVAGSTEQNLACWRVDGGRVDVWRTQPKDWVVTLAPSPDGESLALGSVDCSMRVVRVSDGQVRFSGHTHTESVTALAWSPDSARLATGSADATVKIWCGLTGRELLALSNVRSTVTALAFSPDMRLLAVAAVDLSIRVFNLADATLTKTFFGHQRPVETLAFHPRSWLLASGSRDGRVGLWNARNGTGHGQIDASHQPVSCVAFSPDGLALAAGGLDKTLRVWSLSTPEIED